MEPTFEGRGYVLRRSLLYACIIIVQSAAAISYFGYRTYQPPVARFGASHPLTDRAAAYLADPSPYNVVFIGDSRTYCGIHPELIEKHLPQMHGLNLSNFANWFPTQIGLIKDIARKVPRGALVVWTVGHQNFYGIGGKLSIQRVYPVPLSNAASIVARTLTVPKGLVDNQLYYNPYLRGFLEIQSILPLIKRISGNPFVTPAHGQASHSPQRPGEQVKLEAQRNEAIARASAETDVSYVEVTDADAKLTSVIRYFRRGGYHRTELIPEWFREKQRQSAPGRASDAQAHAFRAPDPEPSTWSIFVEALEVFRHNDVRVALNIIEEAPLVYAHPVIQHKWRHLVRSLIEPEASKRGIPILYADFDRLEDRHYFDDNHLNSEGAEIYSRMLADLLRPLTVRR